MESGKTRKRDLGQSLTGRCAPRAKIGKNRKPLQLPHSLAPSTTRPRPERPPSLLCHPEPHFVILNSHTRVILSAAKNSAPSSALCSMNLSDLSASALAQARLRGEGLRSPPAGFPREPIVLFRRTFAFPGACHPERSERPAFSPAPHPASAAASPETRPTVISSGTGLELMVREDRLDKIS
jgi:hypothetical protein